MGIFIWTSSLKFYLSVQPSLNNLEDMDYELMSLKSSLVLATKT